MNSDRSKLRHESQAEQHSELQSQSAQRTAQEFGSVEEMVRFDTAQTPVPEAVTERLKQSIAAEPRPARSWWRRLFGKAV